jgi:hypothetical protein
MEKSVMDESKAGARFSWIAQYPRSVLAGLDANPPFSMPDLLGRAARAFGDSVSLSFGDQRWTRALLAGFRHSVYATVIASRS